MCSSSRQMLAYAIASGMLTDFDDISKPAISIISSDLT